MKIIHQAGLSTEIRETSLCCEDGSVEENTWRGTIRDMERFNLLKPTSYVIDHQFDIQQLNILPTLYLCVLYLSENKQRLVPITQ